MDAETSTADRLDTSSLIKAAFLFLATFALYFVSRSPGLDEYDSVQFAMGVREFNIWKHQPHPPGYPLYIVFGWLGDKLFGADPNLSLHVASCVGGALFVAAWFLIIRLQFNEKLAWWVATCLAITPIVWMTSTKVLTDALAAGFFSAEILAAICFVKRGRLSALLATSLFGAAATGTRPQFILVVIIVLALALKQRRSQMKISILAAAALVFGCLLWLLPMWYSQARLRPDLPAWSVYPNLLYSQWVWRLSRPQTYLVAGDWSPPYLGMRIVNHFGGWFGVGFGFLRSIVALIAGIVIVTFGFAAYLFWRREPADAVFWKFHAPWALAHIVIIFVCLGSAQRYYVIIYPLLLAALLRGFLRMRMPWRLGAATVPILLICIAIPTAIENHREEAPPIQIVRYLQNLYPASARKNVTLLFNHARRHVEWYAPEFVTVREIPGPEALPELTKNAAAVYTDDPELPLPPGWRRVLLTKFSRSIIVYQKHHVVPLFFIDRGDHS
ncbi:MAG TPA: glycosyltransferase family 39 protein [Chthoniobacterales bacterium]|nr:glycosyltransferase family 39 protein [Chthoniobacterales bacterium]